MVSNTDQSKQVVIPKGTEITMIADDEYYFYIVDKENLTEISLSDFTGYNELKDITNSELVEKTYNEIKGTTSYSFKEKYKFVISFENTEGIEQDTYYPSLEVYYGGTTFGNAKKDVAKNIVNVQKRNYNITLTNDRKCYESDGQIKLAGKLEIGSVKENTYLENKELNLRLRLEKGETEEKNKPCGSL